MRRFALDNLFGDVHYLLPITIFNSKNTSSYMTVHNGRPEFKLEVVVNQKTNTQLKDERG
jgi:hypothetical protein